MTKFDPLLLDKLRKLNLQDGDLLHFPNKNDTEYLREIIEAVKYLVGPNARIAIIGGDLRKLDLLDMNAAGWFSAEQKGGDKHKSELFDALTRRAKALGYSNLLRAITKLEKLVGKQ